MRAQQIVKGLTQVNGDGIQGSVLLIEAHFQYLKVGFELGQRSVGPTDQSFARQKVSKVFASLGFLVYLGRIEGIQAVLYLSVAIAAIPGIGVDGHEHADDATAFFAFSAGPNPAFLLMSGMTRCLMLLKVRISLGEYFLNQQFRQRPQYRELAQGPSFSQVVPGKGRVEEDALVVEAGIVPDTLESLSHRRVEFVSDEDASDSAFPDQGKDSENKNSNRP